MVDLPTLPFSTELLNQYVRVSEAILHSQVPQEKVLAGLTSDAQYARALQGLQLVAQYHQTAMMQALTGWRHAMQESLGVNRGGSTTMPVAIKRVVLELLFLKPAMLLLSELVTPTAATAASAGAKDGSLSAPSQPLGASPGAGRRLPLEPQHRQFCELVQQICFHWLLAADDKVPAEQMPGLRNCILTAVTEAIGALSRVSLPMVGNPFLKYLVERVSPRRDSAGAKANHDQLRAQILRLCSGMHLVHLTMDCDEGVREAVSWLRRAHPLTHTTSQRKSQVHHALAEMFSSILWPLVRRELPHSCPYVSHEVLEEWFSLISQLKKDIWNWTTKHDKHIKDGYPLNTILVCLMDSEQYPVNVDSTAAFLIRQLKSKEQRGLVVRCLMQLIISYLVRYGKGEVVRPLLNKWLDGVVKPLLMTAKKGGLGIGELLEMIAPIAELAPEYAVGTIILDLLTSQVPDCTMASLRALYGMLTTVPAPLTPLLTRATDAFDTSVIVDTLSVPVPAHAKGSTQASAASRGVPQAGGGVQSGAGVLELLRRGMHPFDLLGIGHLLPKVTGALAKLLSVWHMWYGTNAAYNSPENFNRERSTNVAMFCWLIRIIPYSKPDLWNNCKPLDMLPSYITHQEPSIRGTAHDAVLALVKGQPHLRNMMLVSYVSCLSNLNDDQHQLVRAGLVALRNLARAWALCLSERAHARGGGTGCGDVGSWVSSPGASAPKETGAPGTPSAASSNTSRGADVGVLAPGTLHRVWWCCELSGPDALLLDVHRLEGFTMGRGLVSADEGIRREALQFLETLRSLHRALLEAQPYTCPPPPTLLPELLAQGRALLGPGAGLDVSTMANTQGHMRNVSTGGASSVSNHPTHRRGGSTLAGGGSSSDSSAWLEGNMQAGGGEGPQCPGPKGLATMVDPPNLTYLLDIIEQGGEHMVRSAYWDCGDWSDLWQACRPMPHKMPSLEALLCSATRDDVARLRLSRVLIALASTTATLSPLTAAAAAHELCAGRLMRMLARDVQANRLVLPGEYMSGKRADAWRHAACMAAALPTSLRDSLMDRLSPLGPHPPGGRDGSLVASSVSSLTGGRAGRGSRGLEIRDLVRALLGLAVMVGSGPAALQLAPLMALGHLHHEHYPILVEELVPVMEEYSQIRPAKAKPSGLLNLLVTSVQRGDGTDDASRTSIGARSRSDEARRVVAHVFRIVAGAAPREALEAGAKSSNPKLPTLRTRMVEWMRDTYFHLRPMTLVQDVFWDNVQVAYCLASAVRSSALSISDALNEPLIPDKGGEGSNHLPPSLVKGDRDSSQTNKGSSGLSFRKALYELLRFWSCEGFSTEESYNNNVRSGIGAVLNRYRQSYEDNALEPVRAELAQAGQYLDHAARTGMAAVLAGPVFDADARRPQGPVLLWIERLLTHRGRIGTVSMSAHPNQHLATTSITQSATSVGAQGKVAGPERQEVARTALHNLLHANLDMFATCLDKCYDANRVVASSFFQVICEVYATQNTVHIAPHVMLSLILYKMVDEARDVREDSLHMLHVLSQREWGVSSGKQGSENNRLSLDTGEGAGNSEEEGAGRSTEDGNSESSETSNLGGTGGDAVVVLGNLQDSYQQFQYQLSCKLARDHLELSEALCEEMMTRALECWDSTIQHPVLICLAPWMENLVISPHWKGSWCERLLKSMYYVTQRHGPAFPFEIERLWSTLAASKRNIIPILDFLTSLGVYAALQESASLTEYFGVAKRIALYLARISPQHTIDHLAYEINLQVHEDDGSVAAAPGTPMPLSFADITGPESTTGMGAQSSQGMPNPSIDALDTLMARHNTDASQLQGLFEHSSGLDSSGPGDDVAAGALGLRSSHSAVEPEMQRTSNVDGVQRAPTSSVLEGSVARSAPSAAGGTAAAMIAAEGPSVSTSGMPPSLERVPSENSVRSSPSGASGSVIDKSGFDRSSPTNGVQAWGGTIRNLGNLATISVRTGDEPMIERSLQSESIADPSLHDNYDTASTNSTTFAAGGGGGQGVGVRALLSRPELALCLLAEVAYEHDEDFRPHMPLLLHACICVLDQEGDIEGDHGSSGCTVSAHAQQLLMHLLYSVSARYIEAATDAGEAAECPQVSVLIRYLLSMRGRRLWAYEDADPSVCPTEGGANASLPSAAALSAMVAAVHNALAFEVGLQASWAEASLDWALHCRSRHLSCRSFQVFRALHPQLTSDVCCTLLVALQHCFAAAATATSVARASTSGGQHALLGGSTHGGGDRPSLERVDSAAYGRPSTSARTAIIEQAGPPLTTCLACAQEVITTLKSLIEGLDSNGRLVIYPQLFWVALALLHSSSVPLYGHALSLLDVVMSRLKLHQSKVAAVLLASAPTIPGLQAAGPVQQAAVLQSIWAGLTAAGRHRSGMVPEMEEEEEQPELWLLGVAPLGMMPYFQHHFDSPLGCGSPFSANESKDSGQPNPVSCSVDWGSSPAGLGVRYAPLAIQQLLLRGLLVGDTAAASLRTLSAFADALAQQGYAASEHQRRRLRSSASPSTSIDTGASASSAKSTLQSPASVTGTVRAKGRPGSSVWGSDMGITGTLRHTPSAFTSSIAQHELLRQAIAHNSGGPSASSTGPIKGGAGDKAGGPQSSWGDTVGSSASSIRPFDSLQAHASLRMDAHQSLLGPWQGQLFVSLVGVLQFMASLQSARAPSVVESTSTSGHAKGTHAHTSSTANASATSPSSLDSATAGPRRDGPTLSALVQCLSSLTYAAAAHGLPGLAAALNGGVAAVGAGCTSCSVPATAAAASPPFALSPAGGVPSLDMALQSICAEMARALFPRFALLFIHHCLEELTAPGLFPQAHIAAITLLRSMMLQATASLTTPPSPIPSALDATATLSGRSGAGVAPTPSAGTPSGTPQTNLRGGPGGIDLGPSVVASLTNSSLLAPLVERTQGPLAPHAVSALSAVMAYTTQLQQYQQQQQQGPHPPSKPSSSSQPGTPGAEAGHPPPIVLRTLQPPPGSDATVAAAVKRVADTMGGMSARRGRRTARIIPYLNPMGYSEKLHQQQMSQH